MNAVTIVAVDAANRAAFDRLMQCYEAEFSSITEKFPGPDGLFHLDTRLDESHLGFLLYDGEIPVGF